MNLVKVAHKNLLGGQEIEIYTPHTQEQFQQQFFEVFEREDYKKGIKGSDMVIISVGGNIGLAALYFQPYAKHIYSIEPSKSYFEALVENTKNYANITPIHAALSSDNSGLYLFEHDGGGIPESLFGNGEMKEEVEALTIKDIFDKYELDHVDLLKMDAEGVEYIIFASKAFAEVANQIDRIVGEAHPIRDFQPLMIPQMLSDYNYDFEWLPIDNVFKRLTLEGDSFVKPEYTLNMQTMFFAERKQI